MKLHLAALTTGTLLATAGGLALAAGPSASITGGILGTGVLTARPSATVRLSHRNGFVMENATVPAGATFGWHSHRTAVVVAVTAGTLTLYDSSGPNCTPRRYRAGQGFIEPANHIHMARNEGKTRVTLEATYIGVPPSLRANPNNLDANNQPRPHKCPASVQ
ncbi:MAG: cupin domain-containing protein [Solirubrobacteraceae bacterium]